MSKKKVQTVSAKKLLTEKLASRLPPLPPPPTKMRVADFKKFKPIVKSDEQLSKKILKAYTEYIKTCKKAGDKLERDLKVLK